MTCFVSRSRREEVRVQYRALLTLSGSMLALLDTSEIEIQKKNNSKAGTGTGVNKSALSGSRGAFRNIVA